MSDAQRLDKFLWIARFFRSRALAAAVCTGGRVRVNGRAVEKPGFGLKPDDVLIFPQGARVRRIRIVRFDLRRGPATSAVGLYEDLEPLAAADPVAPETVHPAAAAGRPTKRERRERDRLQPGPGAADG